MESGKGFAVGMPAESAGRHEPRLAAPATRLLGCLGLANFLLLNEWQNLYTVYDPDLSYFAGHRYPLTYAWATALAVVLIGTALMVASTLLQRLRQSCRHSVIDRLVLGVKAFVIIEVWIAGSALLVSSSIRFGVAAVLLVFAVASMARLPNATTRAAAAHLLASTALLFPIVLATTLIKSANYGDLTPVQAVRSVAAEPASRRLIWIVLDEFDPTVAFDRRPPGLRLEALDRLRSESFVATRAYAPGSWTLDALPTLWTGRPVGDAREAGPSNLSLQYAGAEGQHQLEESTTIFERAHAAGLKVGIAGWYHPYCRLFGHVAEQCESMSSSAAVSAFLRAQFAADRGVFAMVASLVSWHALWSREAVLTGGLVQSRVEAEETSLLSRRAEIYTRVHARTVAMVRDSSLALVFAHYPVPHLPGFYDSIGGEIDITTPRSYFENLALADRTVGELRRALEEAGLWTGTTLLVHSDHALRPGVWKHLQQWTPELEALTDGRQSALTPFILKLPDQQEGVEYDEPFNAALAHDLVMAVLKGGVRSPADVTRWLDNNRDRFPLSWSVRTIVDR